MSVPQTFFRDDTIFGVCEALGEDLGFDPNLLRVSMGIGLLLSPLTALAVYASAAALVLLTRWLVPDPAGGSSMAAESPADAIDREEAPELPLAA